MKEQLMLKYLTATPYCGKRTLLAIYAMSTAALFLDDNNPAFKKLYKYMSQLRKKGHNIRNVRGKGYRLFTN